MTPDYVKNKILQHTIRTKNGCWNWHQTIDKKGYGRQGLTIGGIKRYLAASRASFNVFKCPNKFLPSSIHICHKCNNSKCVNPKHLYAGNAKTNMKDCVVSGRHAFTKRKKCKNGHDFDTKNTHFWMAPSGNLIRRCRKCRMIRSKISKQRKKHGYI